MKNMATEDNRTAFTKTENLFSFSSGGLTNGLGISLKFNYAAKGLNYPNA
jgi:hypothetical protein